MRNLIQPFRFVLFLGAWAIAATLHAQPVDGEFATNTSLAITAHYDYSVYGFGHASAGVHIGSSAGLGWTGPENTLGYTTLTGSQTTAGCSPVLQPWKPYVMNVSLSNVTSYQVTFTPPAGYTVFIDGVERRSITNYSHGTVPHEFVIRPLAPLGAVQIGEATPVLSFPTPVMWGVSLGTLLNGRPAGHLLVNVDHLPYSPNYYDNGHWDTGSGAPALYTPAILSCAKESSEVEIYSDYYGMRQIKTNQAVVDIARTGEYSFEIRYYRMEDATGDTGIRTVSGTPFVKYKIEPGVDIYTPYNEEEDLQGFHTVSGLKITKTFGSRTEVTTLSSDGLSLSVAGGARVETKSTGYDVSQDPDTGETITDTQHPYQLHQIANNTGTVALSTKRYYQALSQVWYSGYGWIPWGPVKMLKKIEGTTATTPVTTTYVYDGGITRDYADGFSGFVSASSYGRMLSASCTTGYNANFTYYSDAGRFGQLSGATCSDGTSQTMDYSADWTGAQTLLSSFTSSTSSLAVTNSITTNATANSQPLNSISSTQYSSSGSAQTAQTKMFRRHLWDTIYVEMPFASIWPDGHKESYAYHVGDFDESTHAFTVNASTGRALRQTVLRGWNSPDVAGGVRRYTLESQDIDPISLVANKSTKEVVYRNTKSNVVRLEHWVFTGYTGDDNYELLDWTNYAYNDASELTTVTKSTGEVSQIEWTDGLKTAEIDAVGIRTEYTYDALARVATVRKKGVAAGTYPAQADIVTTYSYNAIGQVTSESVAAGSLTLTTTSTYDTAGRLVSRTAPGGVTTTYAYSNGGHTATATAADGSTQIADYDSHGRVASVTGTGVVANYHTYTADANGSSDQVNYATATSDRYGKREYDKLGRPSIDRPNPNWRKNTTYNNNGQLTSVQETLGTGSPLPAAMTIYNDRGEPYRVGIDLNGDGVIDPAGTDTSDPNGTEKVTESATDLVKDGSDWWLVKQQKVWAGDHASAPITTATTKVRITGLASGTIAEARSIDIYGNTTTQTLEIDRTAKKAVERTVFPDSSVSEEKTSINGLLFKRRSKENLTFETRYDSLGRVIQQIDPRTGTSNISYQANTSWVSSRQDAAGNTTTYTYDSMGRVASETNPQGKVTRQAYTLRGEPWRTWGDVPYPVEYVYDSYGQKTEMHTYRGGSGWNGTTWPSSPGTADVTSWGYDAATGYLISKTYPGGNVMHYTRDPNGMLKTTTNGRGQAINYTWTYNYGAPLLTERSSSATGATVSETATYNRLGLPASKGDAPGSSRTFTYALATTLQLTDENLPSFFGSKKLTYKYATSGVVGRPTGFKLGTSASPTAEEDVTYDYDTYGRLNSVGAGFGGGATRTTSYSYTANSNLLASISTPTSGTDVFALARLYESNRDLMTTISAAINTTTVKAAYTYAYDTLGRRTSVIETGELFDGYASSSPGLVEKYTYNDRSELTAASTYVGNTVATTTALPGRDYAYGFDPIGNRTSATKNGRAASYTTNGDNQYTSRTVSGYYDVAGADDASTTVTVNTAATTRANQYFYKELAFTNTSVPVYADVTVVGTATTTGKAFLAKTAEAMSYDADGNLTADGRWSYTWDAVNRLTKMETIASVITAGAPQQRIEFAYDSEDRRIQKKVSVYTAGNWSVTSDTRFLYDGWNVIAEYDYLASSVTRRTLWGVDFSGSQQGAGGVGGLLMVNQGAATYLAAHDGRGNVTALINAADNTVAAAYEYSPFGEIIRQSGSYAATNPWRFSSKFTDAETGLVYYGKRFYSPSQGRFLGRDPIEEGGGLNLYGFCSNNALNGWDYLGMDGESMQVLGPASGSPYYEDQPPGAVGPFISRTTIPGYKAWDLHHPDDMSASEFWSPTDWRNYWDWKIADGYASAYDYNLGWRAAVGFSNGDYGFTVDAAVTFGGGGGSSPPPKPAVLTIAFEGGFGAGHGDTDSLISLANAVGAKIYSSPVGAGVLFNATVTKAYDDIMAFKKQNPNGVINIMGYSAGGDNAVKLANRLGQAGVQVNGLVTFDPHSRGSSRNNATFALTGNNVTNALNYYQTNPTTGTLLNGYGGDNPFSGSPIKGATNIDLSQHMSNGVPLFNHNNIIQNLNLFPGTRNAIYQALGFTPPGG